MIDRKILKLVLCASLSVSTLPSFALSDIERKDASAEHQGLPFTPHFAKPTITDAHLDEAIQSVDKLAQSLIDQQRIPGLAISIVHDDKVVFAKGYGVRETGKPEKIDPDTAFLMASVSKPLASTVVAALVGEGKVSWDSKISDLDPDFEMSDAWVTRQITVRDFFCHRSGLPDHAGDDLEDLGYDRAQVLHRLRYQEPDSSFRAGYAYTNFGITEGAVAAAKAYKLSWEDASAEKLYKPLGMNSTSSRNADFIARENRAHGHVLVDGKWMAKYVRNPDAQSPAGGASSSVNDMAKWMRLQIAGGKYDGKQVISESALIETHKPQIMLKASPINGLPEFYGLGLNVSYDQSGRLVIGHSGAFEIGAATSVRMIPDEKLGICVLTNATPIGVPEAIVATFADTALYGKPTQDWLALFKQLFANPATIGLSTEHNYSRPPSNPTVSLPNSAYTGVYENDYLGKIQVVDTNGNLAVLVGPKNISLPLKHFDRDTFTFIVTTEGMFGTHGLHFGIGPDGKAADMLFENMEKSGHGRLQRAKSKYN